jgi:pyridoxal phosphate enzyme (YggS family)
MPHSIAENYQHIVNEVQDACARSGRDSASVRIIAVSKTVGLPEVAEAIACGIHDFGENRTTLFKEKHDAYPNERWHFIGSIQTNKVKDFVGKAELVHSVASAHALAAIDHRAELAQVCQSVLIEVNVSGEASKDGIAPSGLQELLEGATNLAHIQVRGLMTMAPAGDEGAARRTFSGLRDLMAQMQPHFEGAGNVRLWELSMGMSGDYSIAVEEGATILRIGRSVWQ